MKELYSEVRTKSIVFFDMSKIVGIRVKQYRDMKGWTLADLYEITGIPEGTASGLENSSNLPSYETMEKYIRFTDINPYLFFATEDEEVLLTRASGADFDEVTKRIIQALEGMEEDNKRDILKHLEKEEFIKILMAKFKKK